MLKFRKSVVISVFTMMSRTVSSLSLRQRLLNGASAYGPIILSDSPIVAELLATVDYDFLIIDQEHSPTTSQSTQHMIRAVDAMQGPSVIVRVPSADAEFTHVLDGLQLGGGILVPMVEDAATAQRVVEKARFPLPGRRGCAVPFIRATQYGRLDYKEYKKQCDEDLLLMVQVETPSGIEAIPEIAQVDGVDGIFLGPLDISAGIGKMGEFEDQEFRETIETAASLVRQSDECFLGGFRIPGCTPKEMFGKMGYRLVCSAVDLGLLKAAATSDCHDGRQAISELNDVSLTTGRRSL